jgi:hypothetical protein
MRSFQGVPLRHFEGLIGNEHMFDVFISYPADNKVIADAVTAGLEKEKLRCWIAPRDGSAGHELG